MSIKNVSIIGMGALGMMYGTHMMDHGVEVSFVMDKARVDKYRSRTFYKNEKPYTLPMEDCETAEPADLVMVAVKYLALDSALETMKRCVGPDTIIMSVMNGIDSEEIIAETYGWDHMIYTVAMGMDAMKFGDKLSYTKMGKLQIGAAGQASAEDAAEVDRFFHEIEMPHSLEPDILQCMWSKWMVNVGINQTCMVYETNYGVCLTEGTEENRTLIAAMREVVALAQCEGVNVGERDLNGYVSVLQTLNPTSVPSMRQDSIAGRRTEVDMFAGKVIKLAEKHGLYVPANRFLYKRAKELEAVYAG